MTQEYLAKICTQIGHGQAKALIPTFTALYELIMMLSDIHRVQGINTMSSTIKDGIVDIHCKLVCLIGHISAHYHQKVNGLRPGSSLTISFDSTFGIEVDAIWASKNELCERIWASRLKQRDVSRTLKSLREQLQGFAAGSSVRNLLFDEVVEHMERSEETCSWIQESLASFFRKREQMLSVTGPPASGKSVLTEWVEERLARPLDDKSYIILTYKFRECYAMPIC